MATITKSDFVVDNLSKGDWIHSCVAEKIGGKGYEEDKKLHTTITLQIRTRIEQESKAIGTPLLTCQHHHGILIMTDSQALAYCKNRNKSLARQLDKNCEKLNIIDKDYLNRTERRELSHEKSLSKQAVKAIFALFDEN